jgi:protein SCO1/2
MPTSPTSPFSPTLSISRTISAALAPLLLAAATASAAGPAAAAAAAAGSAPVLAPSTSTALPVAPGSLQIPDVVLVDQDARKVRFLSDVVQGRVVAINFIFTTCTTICPPLGANFARLRQLLGSRAGTSVQLISVSVDPANDTPERLRAWAAKFGAGRGWTLLTGPKPEVNRLLRALQSYTPNFTDHSPLILIGNAATGTWERTSGLAPAAQIEAQLMRLAARPEGARPAP